MGKDSKVKFKQVELTTHNLDDLFIDVGASRVSEPSNLRRSLPMRWSSPGPRPNWPVPHTTYCEPTARTPWCAANPAKASPP
ncbi:hypothetical protein [Streptomyces yatensis]|uniref:hypothetical protein n=1 Tax=Streptomyces yatensis TaxID=155177 RepID=UPI001B3C5B61|nr:hypothetical protein [Streptomyces yatensis]